MSVCLFLVKISLKSLSINFSLFIVYCRFKRKMQDPDMIDLTEPLYLVYASGPTSTSHNNRELKVMSHGTIRNEDF